MEGGRAEGLKNVLIYKLFRPQAINRAKLKGILLIKVKVLKAKKKYSHFYFLLAWN